MNNNSPIPNFNSSIVQQNAGYIGGRYFPSLPTVYLAGDVFVPWRSEVLDACGALANFRDPTMMAVQYPRTPMDAIAQIEIAWVEGCDLVFAYFHEGHKSATGTPAEVGYARAKEKPILMVDERQDAGTEWLRSLATRSTNHMGVGIEMLKLVLQRGHEGIRRLAAGKPLYDNPLLPPLIGRVAWEMGLRVKKGAGIGRALPGPTRPELEGLPRYKKALKNYGGYHVTPPPPLDRRLGK